MQAFVAPVGSVPVMHGTSRAMQTIRKHIEAAARTSAKVLVLGETGVGKDLVARSIHAESVRSRHPFVAINCSGVPETLLESELFGHVRGSFTGAVRDRIGLVQQAHGGTLFLDELGEMSLRMQAMLLRFLETGEMQRVGSECGTVRTDVRVIAATNRDLHEQIARGAFREDLYYRLNVIQIEVPPLRDRGDDLLLLLNYFLANAAVTHGVRQPELTPDAAQLLVAYRWPGNIRELRNVAERLVVQNQLGEITPHDLPREIVGIEPHTEPTVQVENDAAWPELVPPSEEYVELIWKQLRAGGDFWAIVYAAYRSHELGRAELMALVDRGLRETGGSYRHMLHLFNLQESEYKRFHAFLYQAKCNLPVTPYRKGRVTRFDDVRSNRFRRVMAKSA